MCLSFIPSDLRSKSYLKDLLLRSLKLACNFYGAQVIVSSLYLDKAPFANAKGAFLCVRFGDGSTDFSLIYSSKRIAVLIIEKLEGMLFSIKSAYNL